MKKYRCFYLFVLLIFTLGCSKDKNPEITYDLIVDSTFFCEADINDEHYNFPFHDRSTFGTEIYGDSIVIKASLNYGESDHYTANRFWINIVKKFKITDLKYTINNNGTPFNSGDLSNEEFQSMFIQGYNSYAYLDCSDNECNKSSGVELTVDSYHGTIFKTEYLSYFVNREDAKEFYNDAIFNITRLEWLDDSAVLLEGNFSTNFYSFYGNAISIKNGRFKAFCKNITYPEVVNRDLLWNK